METTNNVTFANLNKQLTEIISRLTYFATVERIYYTARKDGETTLTELLIIISDKPAQLLVELTPLLNIIFREIPGYTYRLCNFHQVKECIKKGNLFYADTCTDEKLLYTHPTSNLNIFPASYDRKKNFDKAKQYFKRETKKIQSFNDGADFFISKGDYAQAAFMVQQQIELAFRAIELFALGKDKMTHSIGVHQRYVSPCFPELSVLFNENDDGEDRLMRQLDDVYLAVRYEDNYQIKKEKLLKAKEKGERIQEMVTEIYEEMVKNFEVEHFSSPHITDESALLPQEPETRNYIKQEMKTIIDTITSTLDVQRIFCFGQRSQSLNSKAILNHGNTQKASTHYDLLVITETECNNTWRDLNSKINQDEENAITATLLIHTINNQLKDNNRFFHIILRDAEQVYKREDLPEIMELPEFDTSELFQNTRLHWFHRKKRAEAFMEAAANIVVGDNEVAEVCLMSQAMEQICLGILEVFYSYKPNKHSLNHLFDLCRNITSEVDEVFPRSTADDKDVFDTLAYSCNDIRYIDACIYHPTGVAILHRRCAEWLETAIALAEEKLEEFQRQNEQLVHK